MAIRAKVRKTDSLRRVLKAAQGHVCPYCGERLYRFAVGSSTLSVDHVVPLARGGPDCLGNLLAAHSKCNGDKAERLPHGCELIWLVSVNCRLGVEPSDMQFVLAA